MSYEKQNWQKGDVITAAKLNNIEQGIADVPNVVVANATVAMGQDTFATFELDKTWQEINDADFCVVKINDESGTFYTTYHAWYYVASATYDETDHIYEVGVVDAQGQQDIRLVTETANGYPTLPNDSAPTD